MITSEIPNQNWEMFLDYVTKRRFEWKTKIEILSDELGSQILDDGLPLSGMTLERSNDETVVGIMVGHDEDNHQTHNIKNPVKINFLGNGEDTAGTVEFEEADGTKTLVHIYEPMPLTIGHEKHRELSA